MRAGIPRSRGCRTQAIFKSIIPLLGGGLLFVPIVGGAQERESLAGERAAEALKDSGKAEAERYNIHYGPFGFQVGAGVSAGYTDNTFYSQTNRLDDYVILPEVNATAFMQVSEINVLRLSLGLGYEYYTKNTELNGNAPLVNPDTELVFNLFLDNFRIRMHERFSYQETLFINNTRPGSQDVVFNFNNTGTFSRWDNLAGVNVDWDLNKVLFSAGYDHENFVSTTAQFDYLTRASELFTGSMSYFAGDQVTLGAESQAGIHNFNEETVMNDHWQARVGPFVELKLPSKLALRGGGGYDTAQYDAAGASSDFDTYYAYGRISQDTRYFTHAVSAGREHLLGDNANNLRTVYVRYSISTEVVDHWDLGLNLSAHFNKEYGGGFLEEYTYYLVGLKVGYQFHKYWRADAGYELLVKNSDLPFRDYYRNRVTLGVSFTF